MIEETALLKNELRLKYKLKRNSLSYKQLQSLNSKIYNNLIQSDIYIKTQAILTYVSVGSEVDTIKLIANAFSREKIVAVPCITGKNDMNFYTIKSLNELHEGKFGLLEPQPDNNTLYTDFSDALCVVPAICMDKNGNRIGYGGGYYDRFLRDKNQLTVALLYDDFLINKVPTDVYDVAVPKIITNKKVL